MNRCAMCGAEDYKHGDRLCGDSEARANEVSRLKDEIASLTTRLSESERQRGELAAERDQARRELEEARELADARLKAFKAHVSDSKASLSRAREAIKRWENWWDRIHGQREPMPVRYSPAPAPSPEKPLYADCPDPEAHEKGGLLLPCDHKTDPTWTAPKSCKCGSKYKHVPHWPCDRTKPSPEPRP